MNNRNFPMKLFLLKSSLGDTHFAPIFEIHIWPQTFYFKINEKNDNQIPKSEFSDNLQYLVKFWNFPKTISLPKFVRSVAFICTYFRPNLTTQTKVMDFLKASRARLSTFRHRTHLPEICIQVDPVRYAILSIPSGFHSYIIY